MRFSKELLALAKSPRIRFRELWLSPGIVDSPHTLDVLVFHSDGHVRFYAVDEDVKLTHGLVDAVLLELWRERNTWLRPIRGPRRSLH